MISILRYLLNGLISCHEITGSEFTVKGDHEFTRCENRAFHHDVRPGVNLRGWVASSGSKLSPTVPRSHSTAGVDLAELVSLPRRMGGC